MEVCSLTFIKPYMVVVDSWKQRTAQWGRLHYNTNDSGKPSYKNHHLGSSFRKPGCICLFWWLWCHRAKRHRKAFKGVFILQDRSCCCCAFHFLCSDLPIYRVMKYETRPWKPRIACCLVQSKGSEVPVDSDTVTASDSPQQGPLSLTVWLHASCQQSLNYSHNNVYSILHEKVIYCETWYACFMRCLPEELHTNREIRSHHVADTPTQQAEVSLMKPVLL